MIATSWNGRSPSCGEPTWPRESPDGLRPPFEETHHAGAEQYAFGAGGGRTERLCRKPQFECTACAGWTIPSRNRAGVAREVVTPGLPWASPNSLAASPELGF